MLLQQRLLYERINGTQEGTLDRNCCNVVLYHAMISTQVMVEGAAGLEGFFLEHFSLFVASGILGVLVVFMSSLEFSVLCVRALLLACDGFGVCFTSSTLGG